MKKRFLVLLSMMLLISLMVVGCGNSDSTDESTDDVGNNGQSNGDDEDKVITFWEIGTQGFEKEFQETVAEKFNEETDSGYRVELVPTQNDKYKEKIVIAMSSGEAPDMYMHWSGGPMNEYIDSGFAQPLDDLYEEYGIKDRFMKGALEQSTYEGQLYAVPYKDCSISGIYYNKELFEQYDIEVPTTLSELEAASDKFIENGITPFALANSQKWTGSMYFQNLVARKSGVEPFRNAAAGTGSFEDEVFVWAGEKIQEWVEKGYFPDGVNSMSEDDGQARQLFYTDQAAMYLSGSWSTAILKEDSEAGGSGFYENIGWFKFPAIEDSDADPSILCGTLGGNFISFNCTGEKLEAAFEFASMFSEDEIVDYMVEGGYIPPINGVEDKVSDPITKEIANATVEAGDVQLWYDQYLSPSVANAHLDGNQEVFALTKTPEEANAMMQAAMDEELEK